MTPGEAAALFAVVIAVGVIAFLAYVSYNSVVKLSQLADRGWANIDVALKQRHDELPNLVTAVRGVMSFEQDVLEEVTRQRAAYQPEAPIPEQAATSVGAPLRWAAAAPCRNPCRAFARSPASRIR